VDVAKGKVQGGSPDTVVVSTDSSSDSMEDEEEDDTHKLHRLSQAAAKGQKIVVELSGNYQWERQLHEVIFRKEFRIKAPTNIMIPLQTTYAQLTRLGYFYQGEGLPRACRWTTDEITREQIEISVFKYGSDVHIEFSLMESSALDMANLPARIRVDLAQEWSVVFGIPVNPPDGELTTRLACITSHWDPVSGFTTPWQIRLEGQPKRSGEEGDICATAILPQERWDDDRAMADVPLCARQMPTFIETTREIEIRSMLKLGRDSNWPLSITLASAIDEKTSVAVTYEIDWDKINWEDDAKSVNWCWDKFMEAARNDNMSAPPALRRSDSVWSVGLRKENNAFRIILSESGKSTPEEIGEPITLLFAPRATIKFRSMASNAKEQLCGNISAMYQGRYRLMEQLVTQEWDMIASLGHDIVYYWIHRTD
jgi:hypothetical protein